MHTSDDLGPACQAAEQACRRADHYARVAARLLYDGREADARNYAARYARATREAHQLRNLANATDAEVETSQQEQP